MARKKKLEPDHPDYVPPFYFNQRDLLDVYVETYLLLRRPEKWCRGNFSQDANGQVIAYNNVGAVRWCAVGAVQIVWWCMKGGRVPQNNTGSVLQDLHDSAREMLAERGIVPEREADKLSPLSLLNDWAGYEAVLTCFERTIRRKELDARP